MARLLWAFILCAAISGDWLPPTEVNAEDAGGARAEFILKPPRTRGLPISEGFGHGAARSGKPAKPPFDETAKESVRDNDEMYKTQRPKPGMVELETTTASKTAARVGIVVERHTHDKPEKNEESGSVGAPSPGTDRWKSGTYTKAEGKSGLSSKAGSLDFHPGLFDTPSPEPAGTQPSPDDDDRWKSGTYTKAEGKSGLSSKAGSLDFHPGFFDTPFPEPAGTQPSPATTTRPQGPKSLEEKRSIGTMHESWEKGKAGSKAEHKASSGEQESTATASASQSAKKSAEGSSQTAHGFPSKVETGLKSKPTEKPYSASGSEKKPLPSASITPGEDDECEDRGKAMEELHQEWKKGKKRGRKTQPKPTSQPQSEIEKEKSPQTTASKIVEESISKETSAGISGKPAPESTHPTKKPSPTYELEVLSREEPSEKAEANRTGCERGIRYIGTGIFADAGTEDQCQQKCKDFDDKTCVAWVFRYSKLSCRILRRIRSSEHDDNAISCCNENKPECHQNWLIEAFERDDDRDMNSEASEIFSQATFGARIFNNTRVGGATLDVLLGLQSPEACADACSLFYSECEAWTYVSTSSSSRCSMHENTSSTEASPGSFSGCSDNHPHCFLHEAVPT